MSSLLHKTWQGMAWSRAPSIGRSKKVTLGAGLALGSGNEGVALGGKFKMAPKKLRNQGIYYVNAMLKKIKGLSWWHGCWESAYQCRGRGFEP